MITMEAAALARTMKDAAAVVEARNTIPILANVRMFADGDSLEIVTTNLDVEYRGKVPLARSGQLAVTVEARRLAAIAGVLERGAQIALERTDDGRLAVRSGRSRFVLPVLPVDDFPQLPFAEGGSSVAIRGKVLAQMLARVMWSVSDEPTRYYMGGPFWHAHDAKLRLAATNGHTLACLDSDIPFPEEAPHLILAPAWCRHVERIAAEDDMPVALAWDRSKIRATIGDVVLTGKVIDGTFPDYGRVIPPESEPVVIDPASLRASVRRVRLMADQKERKIKLECGDGKMLVSILDTQSGTASEELPADCAPGHASGFNAAYIDQMLDALGGDSVEIHQAEADHPALLRRVVPDGMLAVIMPMRI